jgi:Nif-specific regulatory protein
MPGRQAREVQALHDAARVLWLATDIREALDATLVVLQVELGMENGTVSLFDPVTGEVFIEAAPEMRDRERILGRLRPGEGIVGRIFATGMPIALPDIADEPLFLNRTGTWRDLDAEPRAFLGVPIRHGRTTLGVLTVDRRHRAGPFSIERDLRLLEILAGMLGARVRLQELENPRRRAVLEEEAGAGGAAPGIVGVGRRMREVLERVERVARAARRCSCGGERHRQGLVARALHESSPRTGRPFVALNCAALEALLEAALRAREGCVHWGGRGDEGPVRARRRRDAVPRRGRRAVALGPGEAPPRHPGAAVRAGGWAARRHGGRPHRRRDQPRPRGGGARRRVPAGPVPSALRRDGELPPLRERREDIPALAEHFVRELSEENGREVRLGADALEALAALDWPGNVRQLRNVLEEAVVSTDAPVLRAGDLDLGVASARPAPSPDACARELAAEAAPPSEAGAEAVVRAPSAQARLLGMTVRQLDWRVRKYGISVERF